MSSNLFSISVTLLILTPQLWGVPVGAMHAVR